MNRLLCSVVVSVILLVGAGCIPTTADIQVLNDDVNTLMSQIDEHQERFMSSVDKVQSRVVTVTNAMEAVDGTLESLIAGNEVSAPFNPYSGLIDAVLKGALALTTVGAAGGMTVAMKRGKENTSIKSKINTMAAESDASTGRTLNNIVNGHG